MNKKFLKYYMETEPEGTSKKYIFLVDNQDIAMNIVMSGYQALYLGQEDDGYYFSVKLIGETVFFQFKNLPMTGTGRKFFLRWSHYLKLMRMDNVEI